MNEDKVKKTKGRESVGLSLRVYLVGIWGWQTFMHLMSVASYGQRWSKSYLEIVEGFFVGDWNMVGFSRDKSNVCE
jgi:hypothetical protein